MASTELQQTTGGFEAFPNFTRLQFKDRNRYEKLIKDMPAIGDIQFSALMTWWDSLNGVQVAELNGNLVIQYWRDGDEDRSGLSLIGTNKVDQSICMIFDYLLTMGRPARLVNVPEFVLREVDYFDMFEFKESRVYDEYVMDVHKYYPLENIPSMRRRRIKHQIRRFGADKLYVKKIDLSEPSNRDMLLRLSRNWWWKNLNNFGKLGVEAMYSAILNAKILGVECVCIYAGEKVLGFCLYTRPADKEYAILTHVKATHFRTIGFDLIAYMLSGWLIEEGVKYANLTEDWGMKHLRMFIMTLGPVNFFRKYTIEPVSSLGQEPRR